MSEKNKKVRPFFNGTVIRYDRKRECGLIKSEKGNKRIRFHKTNLQGWNRSPSIGDAVTYLVAKKRGGKRVAVQVGKRGADESVELRVSYYDPYSMRGRAVIADNAIAVPITPEVVRRAKLRGKQLRKDSLLSGVVRESTAGFRLVQIFSFA